MFQCLSHVVLDEADQMLERGFAENVEEILAASYNEENASRPQMMLFSGYYDFILSGIVIFIHMYDCMFIV